MKLTTCSTKGNDSGLVTRSPAKPARQLTGYEPPEAILAMQRAAGNRATSDLLRRAIGPEAAPIVKGTSRPAFRSGKVPRLQAQPNNPPRDAQAKTVMPQGRCAAKAMPGPNGQCQECRNELKTKTLAYSSARPADLPTIVQEAINSQGNR
jgi:hypothetical protein